MEDRERIAKLAYQFAHLIDDKEIDAVWEDEKQSNSATRWYDFADALGYTHQSEPLPARISSEKISDIWFGRDTSEDNDGSWHYTLETLKMIVQSQLDHDQEARRGYNGYRKV